MTKRSLLRALPVLAFAALPALAQYTGPVEGKDGREPLRTVAEVRKSGKHDHPVRLSGVLAKKVAPEKYLFRDSTGEIRVEIDEEDFPIDFEINDQTRVEIVGEVDKSLLRAPEIDVKRLRVPGEAR